MLMWLVFVILSEPYFMYNKLSLRKKVLWCIKWKLDYFKWKNARGSSKIKHRFFVSMKMWEKNV